MNSWTSICISG